MTRIPKRFPAHTRHAGLMIDTSYNRDGSVDYYVVEGGIGRFYSLSVAKEIAEARAARPARFIGGEA